MSATTHGLSTLVFNVPAISGYVVQTYNTSSKAANVIEVFNESGNRACSRYDDVTNELNLDAVFAGATLPTPGATFTYDSISYELLSIDVKRENKGAQTVNIKAKNSQYLNLP